MSPMPAADRRSRSPARRPRQPPCRPDPYDLGPDTSVGLARFSVHGCVHPTVGPILRGSYKATTQHHGRPVYQRDEYALGLFVMLYYWDTRDGDSLSGWWFGPRVGSDQVWAFHPARTLTPPTAGWRVPYDGPVDSTLVLSRQTTTARRRMQRRHSAVFRQAVAWAHGRLQPPPGWMAPAWTTHLHDRGAPPPRPGPAVAPTSAPGVYTAFSGGRRYDFRIGLGPCRS